MSLTARQIGTQQLGPVFSGGGSTYSAQHIDDPRNRLGGMDIRNGRQRADRNILAAGVSVAGVAQFLLLAFVCRRAGMPLVPVRPVHFSPDVKRVLALENLHHFGGIM